MRALAIAVLLALTGVAVAQPPGASRPNQGPPPPRPNAGPPAQPGLGPGQRIENIKRRIRAMRAAAIVDALKPDQATAGKMFAVLSKYDDVFDRLLRDRAALQARLNNSGAMKDPRVIDKLIDDSLANQRAFWETEEKRLGELRRLLSPHQTARLLVVLPEFERRLQNRIREAIQQGAQGAHKGKPPTDDTDDSP
jgi:hypothetical protein